MGKLLLPLPQASYSLRRGNIPARNLTQDTWWQKQLGSLPGASHWPLQETTCSPFPSAPSLPGFCSFRPGAHGALLEAVFPHKPSGHPRAGPARSCSWWGGFPRGGGSVHGMSPNRCPQKRYKECPLPSPAGAFSALFFLPEELPSRSVTRLWQCSPPRREGPPSSSLHCCARQRRTPWCAGA